MPFSPLFLNVEERDRPLVLSRFADATVLDEPLSGDALVKACTGRQVVSTTVDTSFPREVIEKLPELKLLCTRSVGFDHLDLDACKDRGIIAANVPDYGSHIIAEFAFALLLSAIRNVEAGRQRVLGGSFDHRGLQGMALRGKTIGILGTGRIGRRAAEMAKGFGMKILAFDLYPNLKLVTELGLKYDSLQEILPQCDIVSVHLPSTKETHHLLNAKVFAQMKNGVILVNTARGALIDTAALVAALESGKVSRALCDVLEDEHDLAQSQTLIHHPRALVTPHIAFYADESMHAMFTDCFESIEQWEKGGRPEHAVSA